MAKDSKKDEGGAKRRRPGKKGPTIGGVLASVAGGGAVAASTTLGVQALGAVDDRIVSGVNTAIGVAVAGFGLATKRPYVVAFGATHALVNGALLANDAIYPASAAPELPDGGRPAGQPVLDQVRRELAAGSPAASPAPEVPHYEGGPAR